MSNHAPVNFQIETTNPGGASGAMVLATVGCAAFPDRLHQPQYHNPFPQLHKIAVLPFFNQSREPTVDGDQVAIDYYNELQLIPGFEVMPVGVAKQMLAGPESNPVRRRNSNSLHG